MFRLPIRSRRGNVLLGLLGICYALASGALLTIAVRQSWGFASLTDYLAILFLGATLLGGITLFLTARENFASHESSPQRENGTFRQTAS